MINENDRRISDDDLEKISGGAYIDNSQCVGCGACVDSCPNGAIVNHGSYCAVNQNRCDGCGACSDACPMGLL